MLYDEKKFKPYVVEKEIVERLKAARERVASKWCQKTGSKPDDSVCAQVAITRSAGSSHEEFLRGAASKEIAMMQLAIGRDNLIGWNDAPGRTQAEVVAAFDKAIQLARQS